MVAWAAINAHGNVMCAMCLYGPFGGCMEVWNGSRVRGQLARLLCICEQ